MGFLSHDSSLDQPWLLWSLGGVYQKMEVLFCFLQCFFVIQSFKYIKNFSKILRHRDFSTGLQIKQPKKKKSRSGEFNGNSFSEMDIFHKIYIICPLVIPVRKPNFFQALFFFVFFSKYFLLGRIVGSGQEQCIIFRESFCTFITLSYLILYSCLERKTFLNFVVFVFFTVC